MKAEDHAGAPPIEDVVAILRQVVAGEVSLVCYGHADLAQLPMSEPAPGDLPIATWDEVWAGDCGFKAGDWWLVFFNDCDGLDYLSAARSPDGRLGEFGDWKSDEEGEEDRVIDPCWCLTNEENERLEAALEAAPAAGCLNGR